MKEERRKRGEDEGEDDVATSRKSIYIWRIGARKKEKEKTEEQASSSGGSEIKGGEKLVKRAKGWGGRFNCNKSIVAVILDGEGVGEGERGLLVGRATARVTYEESATGVATSTMCARRKLLRAIFSPVRRA